jgi:signal recognition particle subunit SRP68
VHKLRQNLGIKYGTKMKFIKKDITKEYAHDSKILQVLLFNAEKNWALANETKFSTARKPSQKSRARFFSIKKYAKALEWAKKLHGICQDRTDSLTQLEAHAYQLFLEGSMQFERQNWTLAQGKLIACREIMSVSTR